MFFKKKIKKFWKNSELFREYIKKYRRYYITGAICLLMVDMLVLIHPLIIKKIIDDLTKGKSFKNVAKLAVVYVIVALLMGVGRYFWRLCFAGSSFKSARDIRYNFLHHLMALTGKFYSKTRSGDLMSLATNDLESVRRMLGPGLLITADAIFYLAMVPILLFYLSPRLALYAFITLPVVPFIMAKMAIKTHDTWIKVQDEFANVTTILHENVSGIRINKAYNNYNYEVEKLEKGSKEYRKRLIKFGVIHSIFHPLVELIFEIGISIFVILGGVYTIKGHVSLGTYVAFFTYINLLTWPMVAIGWTTAMYNKASASKNRIEEVTRLELEIKDTKKESLADNVLTDDIIEIKNLSFSYDNQNEPIIKNIRLNVRRGSTLGIIGEVGSGKSTLVNLLPRLFEVPYGAIHIDGIDVKNYTLKDLRKKIAYVPQEVFLFSESIEENISFSNPDIPSDRISVLSDLVTMKNEIEDFSNGFKTMLGEKGINLSGGQKQRLSIARALAAEAPILILDDTFSSVDTEKEEEILRNLKPIIENTTTIIVSHRLSTLKYADRVITIKDGKIVQDGTHNELRAIDGYYRNLYQIQMEV